MYMPSEHAFAESCFVVWGEMTEEDKSQYMFSTGTT